MAGEETIQFGIAVKKIKDFLFFVNEDLYSETQYDKILVRFQHRLKVDHVITFTLRSFFFYPDTEDVISDLHVQNTFEVSNLSKYLKEDGTYNLPYSLLNIIVGLSISHSRALFQKNLAGTKFENLILPIVDTPKTTLAFFPNEVTSDSDSSAAE